MPSSHQPLLAYPQRCNRPCYEEVGAIRTKSFPKFSPRKRPMRARGTFLSPSTTSSRYLIRPSPTQPETAHEIPIAPEKVGDDETTKRQPFGQDRSHQKGGGEGGGGGGGGGGGSGDTPPQRTTA